MKALDYSLPYGRPNEGSLVKQDWDDYLHDLHKTRLRHVRAEEKNEDAKVSDDTQADGAQWEEAGVDGGAVSRN